MIIYHYMFDTIVQHWALCNVDDKFDYYSASALKLNSVSKFLSLSSSHVAYAIIRYLVSTKNRDTSCFLIFYVTRLPPKSIWYPMVGFLISLYPAFPIYKRQRYKHIYVSYRIIPFQKSS